MGKYIEITRPNLGGGYVVSIDEMKMHFEGETDGIEESWEVGDQLMFTLIEMDDDEFKNLDEFAGW